MERLAKHPKIMAWGEIGLDYFYDHSPRDVQREVFITQLELAAQADLPIIIHCRPSQADANDAWEDCLGLIARRFAPTKLGGVLHCFTGNATLAGDVSLKLLTDVSSVTNTAHQSLTDQPGPDIGGFEMSFPLDANLPSDAFVQASPSLTLTASASVPGGSLQTATIDANNTLKVAGFRVFNAGGVQITGFAFSPGTFIPELPPLPVGAARAIEYYNPSYGFFFITAIAQEISDLDSGKTPGWQRTGESFNVYMAAGPGLVAVCRFFGVFGPKSSHFYAPRGLGCEALLPNNPVWQFEGEVFYTYLPDASGGCPAGNDPVFRLYNNGQGGAPNHRFTTSASIQVQMLGEGWIAEGSGSGVGMCSPQQ